MLLFTEAVLTDLVEMVLIVDLIASVVADFQTTIYVPQLTVSSSQVMQTMLIVVLLVLEELAQIAVGQMPLLPEELIRIRVL